MLSFCQNIAIPSPQMTEEKSLLLFAVQNGLHQEGTALAVPPELLD